MGTMRRHFLAAGFAAAAVSVSGCMVGPLLDNPTFVRADPAVTVENPVWVPSLGVDGAYGTVFEKVIDVVGGYFEISYANRYDGWIRTFPRVSPGVEQPWKPGPPDAYQRWQDTLQSIRRFAEVHIDPAQDGGFFIQVAVYKELEDLPRPLRSTAGAAAFRNENSVERQYEVIDPTVMEGNWIPLGHDREMEQLILQRIKKCM